MNFTTTNIFSNGLNKRQSINYHIGLAYEPWRGHWFRGAASRENVTLASLHTRSYKHAGFKREFSPLDQRDRRRQQNVQVGTRNGRNIYLHP